MAQTVFPVTEVPSGGMTVIASGSLSTSTLTLSSISSGYKNLQLVLRDWYPSTDGYLRLTLNNTSVANSYLSLATTYTTSSAQSTYLEDAYILVSELGVSGSNRQNMTIIDFLDYANVNTNKIVNLISNQMTQYAFGYTINNTAAFWKPSATAAINRIDVFLDSGTFSGGTYILYGVK
jgi:hypothetical protein